MSRTALGFLIAPVVIPIGLMPSSGLEHMPLEDQILEVAVGFLIWYLYPLYFAAIFALPLFLLLNRFALVRWWSALLAGILIGLVGALSINGQPQLFYGKLVLLSGVSGLLFWFIINYKPQIDQTIQQE